MAEKQPLSMPVKSGARASLRLFEYGVPRKPGGRDQLLHERDGEIWHNTVRGGSGTGAVDGAEG